MPTSLRIRARRPIGLVGPCAIALFTLPSIAFANPPTPDTFNWQGPCFNCYNYALNNRSAFFAQPGGGVQLPVDCDDVKMKAVADGLRFLGNPAAGQPVPAANAGECIVALGVDPRVGKSDFHWWRINGDGSWSDKPGQTPAKGFGNMAPHDNAAGRGRYTDFCGYFAYTPTTPPALTGGDNWLRLGFSARAYFLSYSGLANPVFDALDSLPDLISRIPTGAPLGVAPQIPDLKFNDSVGCALLPDQDTVLPGFVGISSLQGPRYIHAFNSGGVDYLAAYTELEPTSPSQILYYIDDRGFGEALCLIPSPGVGATLTLAGLFAMARRRRS